MAGINVASIVNEAIVRKSNPILEARYKKNLDPREMDLLTILFTSIKRGEDGEIETVRLSISDLIKVLNINSGSAYKDLARITRNLSGISVDIWEEENQKLAQRVILTDTEYFYGKGYADFYFNQKLAKYLVDLQSYAKYMLKYFIRLDSFYAKRIYELVAQYKNLPRDKSGKWKRRVSIDELRQYLGIHAKEYTRFSNFRMRVLKFSVDQINERTDINLEYEEIKSSRTPDEILFIASEKEIVPEYIRISSMPPDPTTTRDFARLVEYGVKEETARRLVSEHPADVVSYNLDLLDAIVRNPKGRKIENPAGWLVAGIEENRGEQLNLLSQPQKETEAKTKEERKAELTELTKSIQSQHREYRKATFEGFLLALNDDGGDGQKFIAYMESKEENKRQNSLVISRFKSNGWRDGIVSPHAIDYFANNGLNVMSIDEFAKKKGINNYADLSEELKDLERGF